MALNLRQPPSMCIVQPIVIVGKRLCGVILSDLFGLPDSPLDFFLSKLPELEKFLRHRRTVFDGEVFI